MYSVTQRIKTVKQPRGGYIKPKDFKATQLNDGIELNENENIHSSLMGLAVDYLTRYTIGATAKDAFKISLLGADLIKERKKAEQMLEDIKGLDDESIINACKLSGYDVCFRAGLMGYKPVDTIEPDSNTISNIRTMVNRGVEFFNQYGPITLDGFVFIGGYTDIVSSGDGDFLTKDTLWDFKVSKDKPKSAHTLQLLMYYLMGKKSVNKEFETVKNIGIFNPRLNIVYQLEMDTIPQEIIDTVSTEVIGYK